MGGQGMGKKAQVFQDNLLPAGGEWSPLKQLVGELKVDDFVSIRWTICVDDVSAQVLLPFGWKGQVQALDQEGDARIHFPDQHVAGPSRVRKEEFHRLLVWRVTDKS